MKVALVHEFLTQIGGAERVLKTFHEMFPDAPVYTLVYDKKKTEGVFDGWAVKTSFLQNLPGSPANYKWYLPLMPRAIESYDFSGYDLVLSDSSAFAKGIITNKPTIHITYCHTPTRYIWETPNEYIANTHYPRLVKSVANYYVNKVLRKWDFQASQRPGYMIANSKTVQVRIKKYYDRDAVVIYPPVDTDFFQIGDSSRNYYFVASRLEPYKRIDLVVEAFNELNLPLKVAGSGSELSRLKSMARGNIEFLGRVSDDELRKLYKGAKAFVFPAFEDAGVVVLESLASGTPVIGLSQGGTAEFIRDSENGVLFNVQSEEAIINAVIKFTSLKFDPVTLRATALPFSKQVFKDNISKYIDAHRH